MYENDEDIPSEEETEFENTALDLQQQFKKLSAKFQQILLQESSLSHRTSETCQVQQLMIDDLKNEMKELQQQLEEAEDCEKFLKKEIKPETVDLTDEDEKSDVKEIKREISEELNPKHEGEDSKSQTFHPQQQQQQAKVEHIKQEHSPKSKHQFNGDVKSAAKSSQVKEDFEDFDIESEITPSFIMKKGGSSSPTITTTPPLSLTTATPSPKRSFNDVYIERTQQQQQLHATKVNTDVRANFEEQRRQEPQATSSQSPQQTTNMLQTQFVNQQQFVQQQQQQQQQQLQQEDEWLCIQNELNLMNDKQKPITHNDVYNQRSSNQMNDLFPNGCLRNVDPPKMHANAQNNEIVDNIGEFFDSTDDDEVQRSVETRLDAMFGESPVPLGGKNDADTQDIENNLDEIFGNTKSPVGETGAGIIDAIKNKRLWEEEITHAHNFSNPTQNQVAAKNYYNNENNTLAQQYAVQQQQQQQPHQIQLNCNNNPRWMQNMEAQFSDFNGALGMNGPIVSNEVNNVAISRKRHWNQTEDLLNANDFVTDDMQTPLNKKACNGNTNLSAASTISSTSSSPMSQPHVGMTQAHQHDMLNADLLLHDVADFAQQQQQQPQQHFNEQQQNYGEMMIHNVDMHAMQQPQAHQEQQQQQQQHYVNNNHNMQQQQQQQQQMQQAQQLLNNSGNVEFDDDISRHVQNAIDSILNLQNSESDSLPFSLDHSMGSLLGDSILDERQHGATTATNNVVTNMSNCTTTNDTMNTNMLMANNCGGILNKRRMNLVDDLGDCLISGVSQCGDNASNILLNQHSYPTQQQQNMPHTLINQQQQQQQQQQYHQQATQEMLHHQHHVQQQQTQSATPTATTSNGGEVLNDFSCMVANIDEAVKSIMSS